MDADRIEALERSVADLTARVEKLEKTPRFQTPVSSAATASYTLKQAFRMMEETKVTLTRMSDDLGLSRVAVHAWKSGRSTPDIMQVEEMVALLGCKLELVPK